MTDSALYQAVKQACALLRPVVTGEETVSYDLSKQVYDLLMAAERMTRPSMTRTVKRVPSKGG